MKKLSIFICVTLACLLSGCGWLSGPLRPPTLNSYEAIATVQLFAQKMKYEKFLMLEDSQVYYDQSIHRFRLDFTTQSILTLCQARKLLVDVVDDFIAYVNANAELTINRGPFTECDLELFITPTTYYGVYTDVNRVGLITMRNGISHFFSFATLDPDRDHWKKRSEFFWQSRTIVEFQRQGEEQYGPQPRSTPSALEDERFLIGDYYNTL